MSKKKALGRGLSALLSDSSADEKLEVDIPMYALPLQPFNRSRSGMTEIPLEEIEVNPFQPRTHFDQEALQELAESIQSSWHYSADYGSQTFSTSVSADFR